MPNILLMKKLNKISDSKEELKIAYEKELNKNSWNIRKIK